MVSVPILHIIYFSESEAIGGAEEYLYQLVKGCNRSRYSRKIICIPSTLNDFIERFKDLDVELTAIKPIKGRLDISNFLRHLQFFKNQSIDILHFNIPNAYMSQYAIAAARLAGIKNIVATYHVPPKMATRSFRGRLLERLTFHILSKIITVSEASKRILLKNFPFDAGKIVTIYNGVDMERFPGKLNDTKKRQEFQLGKDSPVVGIIGRLSKEKGHELFLRAASLVKKKCPEARFMIVGDGSLMVQLKRLASELGIGRETLFTGYRKDMPDILSIFDVSVVSSDYESFSLAAVESMAMAKPVVATDVEGIPEVVLDGSTGLLVPPHAPEALANAVISLLRDRKRAQEMGARGYERVRKMFNIDIMVERTEELYENILAG